MSRWTESAHIQRGRGRLFPVPANRVMSDLGKSRTTRCKRLCSSLTDPNPTESDKTGNKEKRK